MSFLVKSNVMAVRSAGKAALVGAQHTRQERNLRCFWHEIYGDAPAWITDPIQPKLASDK